MYRDILHDLVPVSLWPYLLRLPSWLPGTVVQVVSYTMTAGVRLPRRGCLFLINMKVLYGLINAQTCPPLSHHWPCILRLLGISFLLQGRWTCCTQPWNPLPSGLLPEFIRVFGLMSTLQKGLLQSPRNTLSKMASKPPVALWLDLFCLHRTYCHLKSYCVFIHLFVSPTGMEVHEGESFVLSTCVFPVPRTMTERSRFVDLMSRFLSQKVADSL